MNPDELAAEFDRVRDGMGDGVNADVLIEAEAALNRLEAIFDVLTCHES